MFENPRRGRQARNFTTNVSKILDLKSSSEQIFSENWRWVPLFNYVSHGQSKPQLIFPLINGPVVSRCKFKKGFFDCMEKIPYSSIYFQHSPRHWFITFSCPGSSWKFPSAYERLREQVVADVRHCDYIFDFLSVLPNQ